jgi:hypothetical protein
MSYSLSLLDKSPIPDGATASEALQATADLFHEGTGKVMNTIPPSDFSYYEMLHEIVQQEPATSLNAEQMGPLAAIGIVKGEPFAPDARMKKILTEAVTVGNAVSRTLFMSPRDPSWYYYPNSS